MMALSSPPSQLAPTLTAGEEAVDLDRMDGLLDQLKKNMVELILQGDDVTRQMWQMYSVFEEIFGRQTMTTSTNQPLKHVVVGDRLKGAAHSAPPPRPPKPGGAPRQKAEPQQTATSPPPGAAPCAVAATATESSTAASIPEVTSSTDSVTAVTSSVNSERNVMLVDNADGSKQQPLNKTYQKLPQTTSPTKPTTINAAVTTVPAATATAAATTKAPRQPPPPVTSTTTTVTVPTAPQNPSRPTSNPLLETIGVLAAGNQDSDDSDLDIVYQQLRYRQRPGIRTQRTHHRHHQQQTHIAGSDPESIGYAGSNSVDSGYKSLCATPEVSDGLCATPEVRRSASDVSASDSSTASGRPRSLDGQQDGGKKIKMGTRSIAGAKKPPPSHDRSPRHQSGALSDVTLDHLMYLRQSLRKDRQDPPRSPNDSLPSSATSSTFRDSDLSPRTVTDEEWRDVPSRGPYAYHSNAGSSSGSPIGAATRSSSRSSSRGEELDQEGGGEGSSEYLLSGVEYYDLESIHEFPPSNSYVTMMEEKTRRFLVAASKRGNPISERQITAPLYRKRPDAVPPMAVGVIDSASGFSSRNVPPYSPTHAALSPREQTKAAHRHHQHHRHHRATDSKLTEAAIRVLEMIEDFRMEEAMARSQSSMTYRSPDQHHGPPQLLAPPPHQAPPVGNPLALRHRRGLRPASTGSLLEQDARSVASYEHHVYEEIMYDLVCSERGGRPPPVPPMPHQQQQLRGCRSRLLPTPPDPRRVLLAAGSSRSSHHKQQSLYQMMSGVHGRGSVNRFLEMEWHLAQERDNLPPDFPI